MQKRGWLRIARISCTASERYSFQQWQSYCPASHFLPLPLSSLLFLLFTFSLSLSLSLLPHYARIHSTFPIKGLVHFASAVRCDFAPRMRARSRTFQNFIRPKRSLLKPRDYARPSAPAKLFVAWIRRRTRSMEERDRNIESCISSIAGIRMKALQSYAGNFPTVVIARIIYYRCENLASRCTDKKSLVFPTIKIQQNIIVRRSIFIIDVIIMLDNNYVCSCHFYCFLL